MAEYREEYFDRHMAEKFGWPDALCAAAERELAISMPPPGRLEKHYVTFGDGHFKSIERRMTEATGTTETPLRQSIWSTLAPRFAL